MNDIKNALCNSKDSIIVGFNIFGYEDAKAVIKASERANQPVLLMTNRDASNILDIEHWGALLGSMARKSSNVVGVHLDHCSDIDTIMRAIDSGYTSVMYDGSKLPIEENIKNSILVSEYAHKKGVIVEGEIGNVPYFDKGEMTINYTTVEDMEKYSARANTDTIAVSVGNIHRLTDRKVEINFDLVEKL